MVGQLGTNIMLTYLIDRNTMAFQGNKNKNIKNKLQLVTSLLGVT